MSIDINENEELNWAELNDYDGDENIESEDVVFIDTNDCIVHEIRKNPKFEQLFETVNGIKNAVVEEKIEKQEKSDKEATRDIVDNTIALSETIVSLERELGKRIKRINFFEYEIGEVVLMKDDLKVIDQSQESYEAAVADAKKLRKEVAQLERIVKRLSRSRNYTDRIEEYHQSCRLTDKRTKLNEDEDFLRKYDLINSFTGKSFALLMELFEKSAIIGNAVNSLEKNGKEREDIESIDGQAKLIQEAFEKGLADGTISKEDYDELMEYIKDAKEVVKIEDYDPKEVSSDKSDLGIIIYTYVRNLESKEDKEQSVEELMKALLDEPNKKEKQESKLTFEELEIVSSNSRENQTKEIENNMIVSLVLESGKYRNIIIAIRDRQNDICSEKRIKLKNEKARRYKDYRLADEYIPDETKVLTEMLGMEVKEENGNCCFGDLIVTPEQFELLGETPKQYKEQLEFLGRVKRAERHVNMDIAIAGFIRKTGLNHKFMADYKLSRMKKAKEDILADKAEVQSDIKVAEFLSRLEGEEIHRTRMLFGAIKQKTTSKQEVESLEAQLKALKSEKNRPIIMGKAITELLKEGEISKEQYEEMKKYIRGLQDGFADRTYEVAEEFERDESDLGLVVYDCIGIIDKERAKEVKLPETAKEKDEEKEIEI